MRIVAGEFRSRVIEAPRGDDTRPTLDRVRENLFNILQGQLRGKKVLDLLGGSGALSLEALSRGAREAVLCDMDREANRVEKRNIERLHVENRCRVYLMPYGHCLEHLRSSGETFDLFFLDPPYRMEDLRSVTDALVPLMADDAIVVIEHRAESDVQVTEALSCYDRRRYGYVGLSLYRRKDGEKA